GPGQRKGRTHVRKPCTVRACLCRRRSRHSRYVSPRQLDLARGPSQRRRRMVLRRGRLLRRPEGARDDDRRRLCDHPWPGRRHRAVDVRVRSIRRSPALARRRILALQAPRRQPALLLRAAARHLRLKLASSPTSVLCARRRRSGGSRALLERGLQVGRPVVFAQQITKGLVGKLLERLHRVAPEQVQGLPGLLVEFHELTPDTGRLLGHDDLLRWSGRRIIEQRIGTSAIATSTLAAGRHACYPSPMPALILPLAQAAVHLPARGALIGLDLGTKTIGVATSDPDRRLATAVETIARTAFATDAARLLALATERRAVGFVLGLPINMDGSEGPRAQSTRAFARNLARLTQLPIALWDERLSTAAVERELIGADVSRAKRAK